MTGEADSVQTHLWPGGWCLVGNGPSYLLFRNPKKEVMHLHSGMHRAVREALKGYSAIQDGELLPLVQALTLASADVIYDADSRTNASGRKWAAYMVVREIEQLIGQFPNRTIFAARLRRLATLIRAAGQYAMYHGAPGVPAGACPTDGSLPTIYSVSVCWSLARVSINVSRIPESLNAPKSFGAVNKLIGLINAPCSTAYQPAKSCENIFARMNRR